MVFRVVSIKGNVFIFYKFLVVTHIKIIRHDINPFYLRYGLFALCPDALIYIGNKCVYCTNTNTV